MRVMVVSSFHISSTRDVWRKYCRGLRDNGIEVVPFDLMPRLEVFTFLRDKMERSKRQLPRDWDPTTLCYEPVLGAAIYHDVEWVLVTSPQYFPPEMGHIWRKAGLKIAAVFTECPYEDTIHTPITSSAFDATFVNDKYSAGLYASFCPFVEYVPHCYEPELHYPPAVEDREDNIIFIGTGYKTRVDFMRQVEWPARLDLWGWWPKEWLRYDSKLRNNLRSKQPTTPEETAELYRKASASFSAHRMMRYAGTDETIMDGEAYSLGPRNWELAACRTFQVSDYRPEVVDVFGDTVPLYETPQEMSQILKRAFDDPSWRKDLAYQQWDRALPYSSTNVMKTVAEVLQAA